MRAPSLVLVVDGREVAEVEVADTLVRRTRGMLLRRRLPDALLLPGTGSVHGVGMTRSLDVALLDAEHVVRRALRLRPFAVTLPRRGVRDVLEAPAGSFAAWGLASGARLQLLPRADARGRAQPAGPGPGS